MLRQTAPGETNGFVGLTPRFLVVPPELWDLAFKITQSGTSTVGAAESATTPNPYQGLVPIEVPTFTDANDWYLVADPNTVATIEVGFYQGRQDPELLIQDQPAVGSVFTNDEFTWKIRHIWGLTVLDFRGFQRATNV
jgi:phage major head subunit gpT-like protein